MEEKRNSNHFWQGALSGALAMFLLISVLAFTLRMSGANFAVTKQDSGIDRTTENKIDVLKGLIDEYYLYSDEIGEDDLEEGIYSGYINALGDPYSVYYDEEETKELYESTSGEYSGIGVVFSQNLNTKVITAVQVYKGSPAEEAGVKVDDILYKVDGEEVASVDLSDVVQKIRGEEGTMVELTMLRGEKAEEVALEIQRRKIEVETVSHEMKEGGIGYIRITEFDSVTYSQFESALEELEKAGMKGLVVDLRANPGGNLMTVSNILDLLLPEGTVVYTEDKNGHKEEMTSDEEHQFTKPMAVLADGNSASAAEIFAGAIQDYELGPIVGTTTYGKGIVQQIIDLKDGTSVKLTISEYFTPKGRNIHKIGIKPDVEVEFEKDEENPEADNQLEAALEEVRKQIEE
ncbi:MAG: S41 family peptidase [Coprococcus sp.]|nr:S41 family peptidase [Coprococcus sp.]